MHFKSLPRWDFARAEVKRAIPGAIASIKICVRRRRWAGSKLSDVHRGLGPRVWAFFVEVGPVRGSNTRCYRFFGKTRLIYWGSGLDLRSYVPSPRSIQGKLQCRSPRFLYS